MRELNGIGDRLREAVNASDKTIVQIAREMGIDRLQIYSWMNGDYKPNTTSLFKLCRCLNVSADWMLGLSDRREQGTIMIKVCGTCKYHEHEDVDDGWVCVNSDSRYCTDWTDYEHTCEDWEGRE